MFAWPRRAFFPMLGINAQIGRTFIAEEDRAGGTPVVLLSYGLWQRRFGGSRDIIGKTINLDLQPYTVVGILPNGFQILQPADVYLPLCLGRKRSLMIATGIPASFRSRG